MVTGAVATGKSELLHDFAEQALRHGALPLSATGSLAERDLPLGVLSQLVRNTPADEHRAATLDLLREGARAHLSRAPGAESFAHVDAQIVDALCTVLLKLSERRPLAIVVDDVQHADRASQLCLSYLARRVRYARVMLVLSGPDHHAHPHPLLRTEVERQPHCRPVRLAHLAEEGVAERVRQREGAQAADRFAARCHELSGGNRLLADAALEDLRATGEPGEKYADAVLACLQRADPDLLPVARALAVMGEPGAAGRLLGRGEAATARAVQALAGAGLLAGGRFRHEAAASAVLAGLDTSELIDLHRRAAELTYQEGAPAAVVAQPPPAGHPRGRPVGAVGAGGGRQAGAARRRGRVGHRVPQAGLAGVRRRAAQGADHHHAGAGQVADRPGDADRPTGRADRGAAPGPSGRRRRHRAGQGAAVARPRRRRQGRAGLPGRRRGAGPRGGGGAGRDPRLAPQQLARLPAASA
ncbi:AAA family ATPase [Nonomuraea ferruginea]